MKKFNLSLLSICFIVIICFFIACNNSEHKVQSKNEIELSKKEQLGKLLFFDENLSNPAGQSCASCHDPKFGFADPDFNIPVSQGVIPQSRFGNRNTPTAAYASFSPDLHWDEEEEVYVGGQFWDGREKDIVEQAKGPFLNILEMNNPDTISLVIKVRNAAYAYMFDQVFGKGALNEIPNAFNNIAEAIGEYESSSELNQFSSKFDCQMEGNNIYTEQELLGLELFEAEDKGNCADCHPNTAGPYNSKPLFTDFTYDNLGTPKNPENPFYKIPLTFNPDGENFIDYGLGAFLGKESEMGKVKVPTLRNVAMTPPYMHNGVFKTLHEVVDFYNTRDVKEWASPEVEANMNADELGNLGLTDEEVDAIVAFMETLTDGYICGKK
ncbi:cytochrome-c peroxidase [Bacteroidota bacterium]